MDMWFLPVSSLQLELCPQELGEHLLVSHDTLLEVLQTKLKTHEE